MQPMTPLASVCFHSPVAPSRPAPLLAELKAALATAFQSDYRDRVRQDCLLRQLEAIVQTHTPDEVRDALNATDFASKGQPCKTLAGMLAAHGWADALRFVIAHGADVVNNTTMAGEVLENGMWHAAVRDVLSGQTGLGVPPETGNRAIHRFAGQRTDPGIKKLLVLHNIDPNGEVPGQGTLLGAQAKHGNEITVTMLLDSPRVDINKKDANGRSAVEIAVRKHFSSPRRSKKFLRIALMLIRHPRFDPCTRFSDGTPLLAELCKRAGAEKDQLLTALLACPQLDVNARDARNRTPLETALVSAKEARHLAPFINHIRTCEKLIRHPGFQPISSMSDGGSPLAFAAQHSYTRVAKLLTAAIGAASAMQQQAQLAAADRIVHAIGERLGTDSPVFLQLHALDNSARRYCAPILARAIDPQAALTDDELTTEVNAAIGMANALQANRLIKEIARKLPQGSELRFRLEQLSPSRQIDAARLLKEAFDTYAPNLQAQPMSGQALFAAVGGVMHQLHNMTRLETLAGDMHPH